MSEHSKILLGDIGTFVSVALAMFGGPLLAPFGVVCFLGNGCLTAINIAEL